MMVKRASSDGVALFQCEECGLHYTDRDRAELCEDFGETYGQCNPEISRDAMEHRDSDDVTF